MKKITSLFLAALFIALSVFSVNAFTLPENLGNIVSRTVSNSIPATESDAPPATESDPVPETELLSKKWVEEHGNEFSADATASIMGIITAQKGKVWIKDGKGAQLITYSTNKNQVNKKTVRTDKGTISFYPDLPFFYIKENTNYGMLDNMNGLSFIGAETTDEGYYVESFATPDENSGVSMAFKNGELERFYIVDNTLGVAIIYEYIITSYDVDDSEFDIPILAINVTALYRFLLLIGVIK